MSCAAEQETQVSLHGRQAEVEQYTPTPVLSNELDGYYDDVPDLAFGTEVDDRFLIQGILGKGGQACIYNASDGDQGGRQVALKVPRLRNPVEWERFRMEVEVTKGLSQESPYIVPFIAAGVSEDYEHPFAYLALKIMPNRSLWNVMFPKGLKTDGLPAERVAKIVTPALGGLALAHDANLVHCDVKPENILVDEAGMGKLTDFGIVTAESYDFYTLVENDISPEVIAAGYAASSTEGTTPGTLRDMAPEVVLGETGPTRAADMYSVGVMLRYALSGRHPFSGVSNSVEGVRNAMENYVPDRLVETRRKDVARELVELIVCCGERTPGNRPNIHEAVEIVGASRYN